MRPRFEPRFESVLLDVDGTLVDSNAAHAHAWAQTLAEAGFDLELPRIRTLIGVGGDRLVEELTGIPRDAERNAELGERRSKLFLARWIRDVRPLPGARTLVEQLRDDGFRYAIASAAKPEELEPLLEIAHLEDLVDIKTTSGDVEESKPDPEVVRAAMKRLSARRETTVMVGDTPYDIEAATAAGVACIAVTSGGWQREALAGAIAVFSGPAELADRFDIFA
jgi:HAD superfamily hydrolase (TIGR01509 family)